MIIEEIREHGSQKHKVHALYRIEMNQIFIIAPSAQPIRQ